MLWLAGLMGLLAACAFSFLGYVAFRRPGIFRASAAEEVADETGGADLASVLRTEPADSTSRSSDIAEEDEAPERVEFCAAAGDDRDEADGHEDILLAVAKAADDSESDWFATGDGTPEFDDFDPQEDDLVVVWDDAAGLEPSVQVRRSEADPALAHVLMGDVIVAQFRTKANADYDHVSLIPLSMARSLGWAHA